MKPQSQYHHLEQLQIPQRQLQVHISNQFRLFVIVMMTLNQLDTMAIDSVVETVHP